MPVQHFRLLSALASIDRKDFALEDPDLLDFENANPLEMGEFLTLGSNYKLQRAANPGVPPGPWALFMEKGRSDTQGIAGGKTTVLFQGGYWAETKIFTGTPTLGQALETALLTYESIANRSGLQAHAAGSNPVVGYCTKVATDNGGWLQFQQTLV